MPTSDNLLGRNILGVEVRVGTRDDTVRELDERVESSPAFVAFANANLLNLAASQGAVRNALKQALVLNDGIGIDIASMILYGRVFPTNLNGTDFVPHYFCATRHAFRIFLVGGAPGVAARAAEVVGTWSRQHKVVGTSNGFDEVKDREALVERIKRARASAILIAMGNPRQELWLSENFLATGASLGFGVGALFDFLVGRQRRAPKLVRNLHMEWMARLMNEPGRLAGRYLLGNPSFLVRVGLQRFSSWYSHH